MISHEIHYFKSKLNFSYVYFQLNVLKTETVPKGHGKIAASAIQQAFFLVIHRKNCRVHSSAFGDSENKFSRAISSPHDCLRTYYGLLQ
jgi:hypothetical protein